MEEQLQLVYPETLQPQYSLIHVETNMSACCKCVALQVICTVEMNDSLCSNGNETTNRDDSLV